MALYPINLALAGRKCLIVGGGAVAERKAIDLLAAEAAVQTGDRILIFGSFYTVAEALEGWQARQAEPMV